MNLRSARERWLDRSFHRQIEFTKRAVVFPDNEEGVIPEASTSASLMRNASSTATVFFEAYLPLRVRQAQVAVEVRVPPFIRDSFEFTEQLVVVRFIITVRSRITGRQNAGLTLKSVHCQTTVFC